MYFFFVNGNMFFHVKSEGVYFLTSQHCASRSLKTMMTALRGMINKHNCRNFNMTDFYGDNEFDKSALKDFPESALMHTCGRKEHVTTIELSMLTAMDHNRSTCNGLPCKHMTILMVRFLIEATTEVFNLFPSNNAISSALSPTIIVEGKPKFNFGKAMIDFGFIL